MSVRVLSWVLDHSDAPGNDRLVLIAIADEADDNGTNAYPSIDRLSRRARINKRTTMRCLERLEASAELVVVRPEITGRGRYNRYGVVMGRDPATVRALVLDPRKGDTLSPIRGEVTPVEKGRVKARKGAPMSAPDPQTQRPEGQPLADAKASEEAGTAQTIVAGFIDWCDANHKPRPANVGMTAKNVKQLLAAGHPVAAIKWALMEAPTTTLPALEMVLNRGFGQHRPTPVTRYEEPTAQ